MVAAGVVLANMACQEAITAPGACPDYCPQAQIQLLDTVLLNGVTSDSSYRGYVQSRQAPVMQVASAASGFETQAALRFLRFGELFEDELGFMEIVSLDSFRVHLHVLRRSWGDSGVSVDLYRLPVTLDSLNAMAELAPYFDDSLLVGSAAVPDSLVQGTVSVVLPPEAFPTFEDDSLATAVGVVLRSDSAAFLDLGTREGGIACLIERFVSVTVADSTEPRGEGRDAAFDVVLVPDFPDPSPEVLAVGGAPSARALLRLAIPPEIVDSADVVRGTLVLPLAEPVRGVAGDSVGLRADALISDVGAKSPFQVPSSGDPRGIVWVPVGTADTAYLDVTHLIRAWRLNRDQPHTLLLRQLNEAGSATEFRFLSTRAGGARPALHVTYVPVPEEQD